VLIGPVAARLQELLAEKATALPVTLHTLEVMPDHVHLFVESDPGMAPAKLAAQLKGYTSRIRRQEFRHLRSQLPSLWSRSYSIGSIGHVSEATVRRDIENQKGRS
jgi:putative transposase